MIKKVEAPALNGDQGVSEALRATGKSFRYWANLGQIAHQLAISAETAAMGDPATGRAQFLAIAGSDPELFISDEIFRRVLLTADAVITVAENGGTIGTEIPDGMTIN